MIEVNPKPLTRLERIAAFVTGRDDEILVKCPNSERHDAIHDASALLLLGLLEFALWVFAMMSFGAGALGIPGALLVAFIIVQLDVRLTSSDNEPRGILRSKPLGRSTYGKFVVRLALCTLFALGSAVATDLALFRGEAIEAMEQDRQQRNQPIIGDYGRQVAALEQRVLGPIRAEMADLNVQLRENAQITQQSEALASRNDMQSLDAIDEARRQIQGTGERDPGRGVLAIDAEITAQTSQQRAEQARGRSTALRAEGDRLRTALRQADARRQHQERTLGPERARLLAERDSRLTQETTGLLTVFMGVMRLHADPERGRAMLWIVVLVWAVTMALEMSFFLRLVFKPASVHDALLNLDRQRRVAAVVHGFERDLDHQRRAVPLRIVPLDMPIHG